MPQLLRTLLTMLACGLAAVPLAPAAAQAQAPAWSLATATGSAQSLGASTLLATATDASGNVFVTGRFEGTTYLGSVLLTSASGTPDIFVAKYVPGTGTWAWAVRAGGNTFDTGLGIAVSGNRVYVTGVVSNTSANFSGVQFESSGGTAAPVAQYGVSAALGNDLFVACYTDNGSSVTCNWSQVAGGNDFDQGNAIAVSGTSVYVTGFVTNTLANASAVLFGGSGPTPGTAPQHGASSSLSSDLLLAKYTDNGPTATLGWTQIAGGTTYDEGLGLAASGPSVYVTGYLTNNTANAQRVLLGGQGTTSGTMRQNGATSIASEDLLLAKYTDNGPTATLAWTQIAGGTNNDRGCGVALSGSSVYLTGSVFANTSPTYGVVFGGTGTTAGTVPQYGANPGGSPDQLLAKYTDNGPTATFNWSQVGGGYASDYGYGLAVSGSSLYVVGTLGNSSANDNAVLFGAAGTTPGTTIVPGATLTNGYDMSVAKYVDLGPRATLQWAQTGGCSGNDNGYGIALSAAGVYVVGMTRPPATFGALSLLYPYGNEVGVLGGFGPTALAVRAPGPAGVAGLRVFPNPAPGAATLAGAAPGAPVQVLDALGRLVGTSLADADGAARLVLPPGLYVVRAGTQALRLAVE
jgi:hypothetical protein